MPTSPCLHEPPPDAQPCDVPEALIQEVWVRQAFDASSLRTTDDEPLEVVTPGRLNHGAGPDISHATVRIGSPPGALLWTGDIEIHRTSRDWTRHRHHKDPAYRRVILHVVLGPDAATGHLRRDDGSRLPELVLLPYLSRSLRDLLVAFYTHPKPVPRCAPRWDKASETLVRSVFQELGRERLRSRVDALERQYAATPNLSTILRRRVFRALGYTHNADSMETLAERTPERLLQRNVSTETLTEALLRMSGIEPSSLFEVKIRCEEPPPLPSTAWRRSGRPANAPGVRIRQAGALLANGLMDAHTALPLFLEAAHHEKPARELTRLFTRVAPQEAPPVGRSRAVRIVENAVLPVLLLDARLREDPGAVECAHRVAKVLPAESDRVTRRFSDLGSPPRSALEAQGQHQLQRTLCEDGGCARCPIGRALYPALSHTA